MTTDAQNRPPSLRTRQAYDLVFAFARGNVQGPGRQSLGAILLGVETADVPQMVTVIGDRCPFWTAVEMLEAIALAHHQRQIN